MLCTPPSGAPARARARRRVCVRVCKSIKATPAAKLASRPSAGAPATAQGGDSARQTAAALPFPYPFSRRAPFRRTRGRRRTLTPVAPPWTSPALLRPRPLLSGELHKPSAQRACFVAFERAAPLFQPVWCYLLSAKTGRAQQRRSVGRPRMVSRLPLSLHHALARCLAQEDARLHRA